MSMISGFSGIYNYKKMSLQVLSSITFVNDYIGNQEFSSQQAPTGSDNAGTM